MKFSLVALLAVVSVVAAQDSNLSSYPSCSVSCLQQAISQSGCAADDIKCQCTTGLTKITNVATPCVLASCSQSDALQVQSVSTTVCNQYKSGSASGTSTATSAGGTTTTATSAGSGTKTSSTPAAKSSTAAAAAAVAKPFGGAMLIGLLGALAL